MASDQTYPATCFSNHALEHHFWEMEVHLGEMTKDKTHLTDLVTWALHSFLAGRWCIDVGLYWQNGDNGDYPLSHYDDPCPLTNRFGDHKNLVKWGTTHLAIGFQGKQRRWWKFPIRIELSRKSSARSEWGLAITMFPDHSMIWSNQPIMILIYFE